MNIKGLLLGSAAAFVAATGARAADAPVTQVEPEPVEYVRVCDVYGTGFFYIPGTETCLKIGGYIRARVNGSGDVGGVADNFNGVDPSPDLDDNNRQYDFNTQIRSRLEFDAREETELGTLRSWVRLQATNIGGSDLGYGTSDGQFAMDQGFIQLGGLTVGKLDSLWAGDNDGLFTDNDWSVGDLSNNQVRYTFKTGGLSISGSVEDDGDGDGVPDVVAQIYYEGGWGFAYIEGLYDEDEGDPNLDFADNLDGSVSEPFYAGQDNGERDGGAFAIKGGVQLKNILFSDNALKIEGHYAFDPTEYASLAPGGYLLGVEAEGNANAADNFSIVSIPEEWQIGAGYQQSFGNLTAYVSGIFGRSFNIDYANGTDEHSDIWGVAGNVGYKITSNLSTLAEVSYRKVDLSGGLDDVDQTRGFLELRRDF